MRIVDIAVSDSGEVYVATTDDICALNLPDYTPSFHYASLQSGDSLYYAQDTIVLPYEQSIDVAMRAVQIEYGDRILYNWRLVGQSDDWNGWSKERDVRLERLPRGEYTFEWKMLLPDGGGDPGRERSVHDPAAVVALDLGGRAVDRVGSDGSGDQLLPGPAEQPQA